VSEKNEFLNSVDDRQTARSLVNSIKEIPGVIQVSYELSLEED